MAPEALHKLLRQGRQAKATVPAFLQLVGLVMTFSMLSFGDTPAMKDTPGTQRLRRKAC